MTASEWLVLVGGALQVVGVSVVFVELASIRKHEFNIPTPRDRMRTLWRRVRKQPQIVRVGAADSIEISDRATAIMTPAAPGPGATDQQRLAYVERYVDILRKDVKALYQEINHHAERLAAEVRKREDAVRAEMDRREEVRRERLRPYIDRQAIGGACLVLGLLLATIGSIA